MTANVDIDAFRKSIFRIVEGVATENVSFAFDELGELLCMWFDDHWHYADKLIKDGILTKEEFLVLERFSNHFGAAYPKLSEEEESHVRKLKQDPRWRSVVVAAQTAQAELKALRNVRVV